MPAARAASSMLRCDSRAVMACSFLRPNFVPCPTICTSAPIWAKPSTSSPVLRHRSICLRKAFTFKRFRGIHVMTAQSAAHRRTTMTTFTIDEQNNISAFSNQDEAAAATQTPFDSFASQKELAELAKAWPAERLVAIFNSLTGVTPVESFKSNKAAASRIWERIKGLGAPEEPKPEQATKPKAKKN